MKLSAIVCAHNPRVDYLYRVLEALQRQTLERDQWELLLVDNACERLLATDWDLSWHPLSRHIREDELGLTPARLRGIKESKAPLLVFVDDDNVLSPDYLFIAAEMAEQWPMLGAWSGEAMPAFETEPTAGLEPYLNMMVSSLDDGKFGRDVWSNLRGSVATPSGTGMCVRRSVAEEYHRLATSEERRCKLDRTGASLISGGDTDMAYTACDLGLGVGCFHKLKLTHLIPSHRVTLSYLLRLREAMSFSEVLVESFRSPGAHKVSRGRRILNYLRAWTSASIKRQFSMAALRGQAAARRTLARHGKPSNRPATKPPESPA